MTFERALREGIRVLETGDTRTAGVYFARAMTKTKLSRLQRGVASIYYYGNLVYRWERAKEFYGNGHIKDFETPHNFGEAWSDVEIAAVLLSGGSPKILKFLAAVMGRTIDAITFQYKYSFQRIPSPSWTAESGERYTRWTQNQAVRERLGI